MSLEAFGPNAQRIGRYFPPDLEVIIADPSGAPQALAAAVERKRNSSLFYGTVLLDDPRSAFAHTVALNILTGRADYEGRRLLFEELSAQRLAVNGQPQVAVTGYQPQLIHTLRDIVLCSDALLVRSWGEHARLAQLLGRSPMNVTRGLGRANAPDVSASQRRGVVVWAPHVSLGAAAITAFALEELHAPVTVVTHAWQDGSALRLRARFVGPQEAREALSSALAVVLPDPSDPTEAVAFASLGIPMATAITSGSHEYVDGVALFEPWDIRSILFGVLNALGADSPRLRAELPYIDARQARTDLEATLPAPPPDLPMVSIILPTLNRHAVLPRAAECIRRQRYPAIEVIAINDGGAPIEGALGALPNLRIINHAEPRGGNPSVNEGTSLARGEYVAFLADDDLFFPDHLLRLVHALHRTGADAARGIPIAMMLKAGDDGYYALLGQNVLWDVALDPTETRSFANVGSISVVMRRSALTEIGCYDSAADFAADYDLQLHLLDRSDFISVKAVTASVDYRFDQSQWQYQKNADHQGSVLEYVLAKHPVVDRPRISQARGQWIAQRRGGAADTPPSPSCPLVPPVRGDYPILATRTPNGTLNSETSTQEP